MVKVWKIKKNDNTFEIQEDGSANTKCRITSMQVHKVPKVITETPDVKPEDVEKLAEVALKRKKAVAFLEAKGEKVDKDDDDTEESGKKQKLVVELDNEDE